MESNEVFRRTRELRRIQEELRALADVPNEENLRDFSDQMTHTLDELDGALKALNWYSSPLWMDGKENRRPAARGGAGRKGE